MIPGPSARPHPVADHVALRDVPCPACGYNLRGLRSPACPECGRALTMEDLAVAPMRVFTGRWRRLSVLAVVTCAAALTLIVGSVALGSRAPALSVLVWPIILLSWLVATLEVSAGRWSALPTLTWSWVVIELVMVALAIGIALTIAFR